MQVKRLVAVGIAGVAVVWCAVGWVWVAIAGQAGDAVYFASSMYGGVAYFTPPLTANDAAGDAGEITVFDTTSAPIPVQTRGRHLVVSASGVNGRRTLVEVFELSNDTTLTAVAGARSRATWSTALAPNATNFQVGQSDIGGNAVHVPYPMTWAPPAHRGRRYPMRG